MNVLQLIQVYPQRNILSLEIWNSSPYGRKKEERKTEEE